MLVGTSLIGKMGRWVAGVVVGLILLVGCTAPQEPEVVGTDVIIFIDFSESVRKSNKNLFKRDITDRIIPSLSAGDRILIAPINDKTLTGYHPLVEATFPRNPPFSGWLHNTIKHEREVKQVEKKVDDLRKQITGQITELFEQRYSSQRTDIFSSLLIAQKLFHNEQRRKVLVLMSDMIVDYPPYRFDRITWASDTNEEIISDLTEHGLIPNLSGVCVYVTGVTAKSARLAKDISKFWQAYFEQSDADMDPSRYAHVLLHWPPSESCSSPEKANLKRKV
jgi:hypothetical protein